MKFECPHCRQRIEAGEEFASQNVACPTCGGEFSVPVPALGVDELPRRASAGTTVKSKAKGGRGEWIVTGVVMLLAIAGVVGFSIVHRSPGSAGKVTMRAPGPARKYTQMTQGEAEAFALERIAKQDLPSWSPFSEIRAPDGRFDVKGVEIGDGDYVALAPREQEGSVAISYAERRNISKYLPAVERPDIAPLLHPKPGMLRGADSVRAERMKRGKNGLSNTGLTEAQEKEEDEHLLCFQKAGIFWTTTDLAETNSVLIQFIDDSENSYWGWRRDSNIIPKGVYDLSIGAIGVLLRSPSDTFLIPFESPVKELAYSANGKVFPRFVFDLTVGENGIRWGSGEDHGPNFIVK